MLNESSLPAQPANSANPGTLFLTINGLSCQSGLSRSTLHRLKRDGKIPYYQPSGKGGRLLFPLDAIEQSSGMITSGEDSPLADVEAKPAEHLSGPRPSWMQP